MKPEKQQVINECLTHAANEIDSAVTQLCVASSTAIMERQFVYAMNLISKAQAADLARAGCLSCVLEKKEAKAPEAKP
jgi:hypothetical protein